MHARASNDVTRGARVQVSALRNQLAQVQAERDSLQKQLLMSEPIGPPQAQSPPCSAQPTPRAAV